VGTHAYLASAEAGLEVLKIDLLPCIAGVIRKENLLEITWQGAPCLKLQSALSLSHPIWVDVPGSDGQSKKELLLDNEQMFYRLVKQQGPVRFCHGGRQQYTPGSARS
jgi:hypothetical protein